MLMQKLIAELTRLYLPGAVAPHTLEQHILGQATAAFGLADGDGKVRALVIPFDQHGAGEDAAPWTRLCEVANALQAQLGFPAPAVSISGANGYRLWLSLETAVSAAQAQEFLGLLGQAYFPEVEPGMDTTGQPVELPPCVNPRTGKWTAFIDPGMGSSFIGDCGLEMAPSLAGQVGFLEGLKSISAKQFAHGLAVLGAARALAPAATPAASEHNADSLLLKDATLEDIVRHLHAKNIEPTFRHLLPQSGR